MENKKEYVWGLIGRFVPQGIYLLTTIILARYLRPEDFGIIGVLSVIFVVAGVLLESGLGGSLIKEKIITKLDCSTIFSFNLYIGILVYIVLFFSSDFFESLFDIDGISDVIKVISLVFPITAVGIVPSALLSRDLKFKNLSYSAIIATIIASIFSIIIAIIKSDVYALVFYQIVYNLSYSITNSIYSHYHFSFKFSFTNLRKLLPFGLTTSFINVVDTIYENIMTTLTGIYMTVSQAGLLYQSKRVEETMSISIGRTIGSVTFPLLTRYKNDIDKFYKESVSTFLLISGIMIPILTTIGIFSQYILLVLFGKQWISAYEYLEILTFSGCFIIMETMLRNFIKALCRVKQLLYITILKRLTGVILIFCGLIIDPNLMIWGYLVSSIVGLLLNFIYFFHLLGKEIKEQSIKVSMLFLLSLLYFIVFKIFIIQNFNFLIAFIFSLLSLSVIYIITMFIIGIDIHSIIKRFISK